MFEKKYREKCLAEFKVLNFTPERMVSHYQSELKRLRISIMLGDLSEADTRSFCSLDDMYGLEDPLLAVAHLWLYLASAWPPKEVIAGIENKLCLDAALEYCKWEGGAVSMIPAGMITEDFVNAIAEKAPDQFIYLPGECMTKAMVNWYLDNSACDIELLPEKFQTLENWKKTLSLYPERLSQSPLEIRNELVNYIVNANPHNLSHVSKCERDSNTINNALEKDGSCLKYIGYEEKTLERCLLAVSTSAAAVKHVPFALINSEHLSKLVDANPEIIKFLEPILLTESMLIKSVSKNPDVYSSIPKYYQSNAVKIALRTALLARPKYDEPSFDC